MNSTTPVLPADQAVQTQTQTVVLLVDDQTMVAEVVCRLLASEPDIAFHYCTDPSQAIGLANQIHPTLILPDLVMPGLNGMTLVRRFRENHATKTTPIVVLSSKEDPIFRQDALANGANDYLVKLPDRATLVACIRKHIRQVQETAQPADAPSVATVAA